MKHLKWLIPVFIIAFCFLGFLIAPNDPEAMDIVNKYAAPSVDFPLGTDQFGRCELSRLLYGGKVTLGIVLLGGSIVPVSYTHLDVYKRQGTMQQQKKPFSLMVFIKPHRAGFITSVILAVLSVASGMVPYFAVARMVNLLISGEKNFSIYLAWGAAALVAYLLKSVLHGISTRCSHEATFHVLSELRRAVADKLTRVSMGYLTDTPSGRLKTCLLYTSRCV